MQQIELACTVLGGQDLVSARQSANMEYHTCKLHLTKELYHSATNISRRAAMGVSDAASMSDRYVEAGEIKLCREPE